MRSFALLLSGFFIATGHAADPEERIRQEVQKALIQRDQQSAEFATGTSRPALEALHRDQLSRAGRPLHADPVIANELRPYERSRMAREREAFTLRLPPPRARSGSDPDFAPLPLPGGPEHGVQPVTPEGVGG